LSSATGSGKGSIPFELYLRYWNASHRSIAALEPTVTTAISIPMEIMSNVPKIRAEFRLGKNAGYQTGNFVRKPVSGVVFMTTGVLCQMLRVMTDEQFMRRFQFILIDEAHMRRLDTDIILYLLKSLLMRNLKDPLCPMVVAMSGTMPISKYAKYLDVAESDVINVNVQQFPKDENYAASDVPNYVDDAVKIILRIHNELGKDDAPERGDIIVFVQSAKPGAEITERIAAENKTMDRKILVTNVNSDAFRLGTS
jgi:HrpA-like RNA helicase